MIRSLLTIIVVALALPVGAQQAPGLQNRVVVVAEVDESVDPLLSQSQFAELASSVVEGEKSMRFVESRIESEPTYRLVVDVELQGMPEGTASRFVMPLEMFEYEGKQLLAGLRPRE